MDTLGKRIRYARSVAGHTQGFVAGEFGIDRVNVTQWEGDTTKPDIDKLPRLAEILNTTVEWLLDAAGAPPGGITRATAVKKAKAPVRNDNDEVREIDARAGAGGGGTFDLINVTDDHGNQISAEVVKDHWKIPTSFLRGELRLEASKALMIEVTGDSGYDPDNPHAPGSVFPGDRVIVDARDTRPSPPGPFLVYDGTGFVVKLCDIVHRSDPPAIRLSSRNPTYPPYDVTLDDGHVIVGRVVGRFTRM